MLVTSISTTVGPRLTETLLITDSLLGPGT